jgi:hypothetical protein
VAGDKTALGRQLTKPLATKALMIAHWRAMTKAGSSGGKQRNDQPTMGAAKGRWQLVLGPPEGSSLQLALKVTKNKSVDRCTTACNDKTGQWTTMQLHSVYWRHSIDVGI